MLLKTYFVSASRVCLVDGTLRRRNLDTGASGTKQWALSRWDGPGAPTAVCFDPGGRPVSVEITTRHPEHSEWGRVHGVLSSDATVHAKTLSSHDFHASCDFCWSAPAAKRWCAASTVPPKALRP